MYRIGIIGSENSHALAFSKIFNSIEADHSDLNCRVVAIMGEDIEASRKIVAECDVPLLAASPMDMLGKIDAVMVTSRSGSLHANYVRPFIEAGLPAFIDKPVTIDGPEALELMRLARKNGAKVMGGSSTKLVPDTLRIRDMQADLVNANKAMGGSVWAPLNFQNPYDGFYFYSSHLIEICMAIFGQHPRAVFATEKNKSVTALLEYDSFAVSCHFTNGAYNYGATLLGADGPHTFNIDISDCYMLEAVEFANMLAGAEQPQSYAELIAPVYVLNAIKAAYETGTRQLITLPNEELTI